MERNRVKLMPRNLNVYYRWVFSPWSSNQRIRVQSGDAIGELQGGIAQGLANVFILDLRKFRLPLRPIRIQGGCFQHAPDGQPQVAETRLAVHPIGLVLRGF